MVAKGARKGGSRLAGSSEPLTLAELHLASGRHASFVTQAQPITSFPGLRQDFERLSAALSIAELYATVAQAGDVDPEGFHQLEATLRALESHPLPRIAAVWGQARLLAHEGILPACLQCAVTGEPLRDNPSWFSPSAGGLVDASVADAHTDGYRVRAEVLIGLAKIAELAEPPASFKLAEEAIRTLAPYWRFVAHAAIPATDSYVRLMDQPGS